MPFIGGAQQKQHAQHDRRHPPQHETRRLAAGRSAARPDESSRCSTSRQIVVPITSGSESTAGVGPTLSLSHEGQVGHDQRAEERHFRNQKREHAPFCGLRAEFARWLQCGSRRIARPVARVRRGPDGRPPTCHADPTRGQACALDSSAACVIFVFPIRVVRMFQVPQRPAAADGRDLLEVVGRRRRGRRPFQRPGVPRIVAGRLARIAATRRTLRRRSAKLGTWIERAERRRAGSRKSQPRSAS